MRLLSEAHCARVQQQEAQWVAETALRWEVAQEQSRRSITTGARLRHTWLAAEERDAPP